MEYLYLILNIGTISIPLLYSIFEKKFNFIQYAKFAFLSIGIIAIPFLIWDAFFTKIGVWGFNSTYHLSFKILRMPIEEWLFFVCIPYACLFTHEGFKYYFPKFRLKNSFSLFLSVCLVVASFVILIINFGKWYTTVNFSWFLILMIFTLVKSPKTLREYYPSFFVILIPFFIVNGILTGSFIENEVVWYNNNENMGIRIGTVPLEDAFYAFNLLFSIQLIFNCFLRSKRSL